ncbi:MAG: methyltransferase [Bacteroidota bacterium]
MSRNKTPFRFKQFEVSHTRSSMKVGTDAVLLGAWVEARNTKSALDVGTGSGVVALMLAQRFPDLRITGIDIHKESVIEAEKNFYDSSWKQRLKAVQTSLDAFEPCHKFDLVVSNPPFFDVGNSSPEPNRSKARHTLSLSHEQLITVSCRILSSFGSLAVVIPALLENSFRIVANHNGLYLWRKMIFKSKKENPAERVLLQLLKIRPETDNETELVHYDSAGNWTKEYKALTRDFYVNL